MQFDRFDPSREIARELSYFESWSGRTKTLADLRRGKVFDVIIIGASLAGATLAHLSALAGLRTLLIEQRSLSASYYRFANDPLLPRLLSLPASVSRYSANKFARAHPHLTSNHGGVSRGQSTTLFASGSYLIEALVASQREGAVTIGFMNIKSYRKLDDDSLEVQLKDALTGEGFEICSGIIYNTDVSSYADFGRVTRAPWTEDLRTLTVQEIFLPEVSIVRPASLPVDSDGSNAWARPYQFGTQISFNHPQSHIGEKQSGSLIDRQDSILNILKPQIEAISTTGCDTSSSFSYLRQEPLYKSSLLSWFGRRSFWRESGGVLYLTNLSLASLYDIAFRGLSLAFHKTSPPDISSEPRCLPGSFAFEASMKQFDELGELRQVPAWYIERAKLRFGSRVRYLFDQESYLDVVEGICLKGELLLAVATEQAVDLIDLLHGRLGFSPQEAATLSKSEALKSALVDLGLFDQLTNTSRALKCQGISDLKG